MISSFNRLLSTFLQVWCSHFHFKSAIHLKGDGENQCKNFCQLCQYLSHFLTFWHSSLRHRIKRLLLLRNKWSICNQGWNLSRLLQAVKFFRVNNTTFGHKVWLCKMDKIHVRLYHQEEFFMFFFYNICMDWSKRFLKKVAVFIVLTINNSLMTRGNVWYQNVILWIRFS